jgi:hypothetical protein
VHNYFCGVNTPASAALSHVKRSIRIARVNAPAGLNKKTNVPETHISSAFLDTEKIFVQNFRN